MVKVSKIESVEDILKTHEGTPFTVTYVSGTGFKVEPVEPKSGPDIGRGRAPQPGTKPPKLKHATHTPVVGKGLNIAIREGPLKDLLELETVDTAAAMPVIREWYPLVTKYTLKNYAGQHVRWMRQQGLIDDDGKPVASSVESTPAPSPKEQMGERPDIEPEGIEGGKKATDTPVVERTATLAIRQGPMDDILKLENVNVNTVRPILRMWYPHIVESSFEDYTWRYLRFLRDANYIDGEGRVLNKPAPREEAGPEEKKPAEDDLAPGGYNRLVALLISHPKELLDSFTEKFERATDIFDRFAEKTNMDLEGLTPVLKGMAVSKSVKVVSIDGALLSELVESGYPGSVHKYRKRGAVVSLKPSEIEKKPPASMPVEEPAEVEDVEEQPDLIHPIRKDLTVVTVKGKVEIYLKPLNELLKYERIDDEILQRVLVKYYDVSRVSFMVAIRETWVESLKEGEYVDDMGKPTCKEVKL